MRKLFTLIAGFVSFTAASAQSGDTALVAVKYAFTHVMDTTQPDNPLKENMVLYIGANMSNYTSWDRIERIAKAKANAAASGTGATPGNVVFSSGNSGSITAIDPATIKSINVSGGTISGATMSGGTFVGTLSGSFNSISSYFKDQSAGKLDFMASAGGKLFAVEEKTPAIDWKITEDTKEIQGLACQKAVGDFRGRTYEAWFTSQLPYSNGPWKLGGLPGLIVEASDTKKEVMFKFISFENVSGPQVSIEVPSTAVKTTQKEYKQYQEALAQNRQATNTGNVTDVVGGGRMVVTGFSTSSLTGPDGKPVKPRRMNNPIEKDTEKK